MCGTDNYSKDFKAKKYKLDKHFLSKVKVIFMKWKMSSRGSWIVLSWLLLFFLSSWTKLMADKNNWPTTLTEPKASTRKELSCCQWSYQDIRLVTQRVVKKWLFYVFQTEFRQIMKNLPAPCYDSQIEDMWSIADTDRDGYLSYQEFCVRTAKSSKILIQQHAAGHGQSTSTSWNSQTYYLNIFSCLFSSYSVDG